MDMEHLWVAIIAGGKGTRLFPISHPGCPKQFCQLDKKNTFIQAVIENFASLSIKRTHMIVITTDENQTALAKKQCLSRGILSQNIVQIDPNLGYAGAMIYATQCIYLLDKDAVVISTPSDQYLSANEDFRDTIKAAYFQVDESDDAVIIGVKINDIVTAMGCGHAIYQEDYGPCYQVTSFVEKPDRILADKIMRQGNSACNTGINVWRAYTINKLFTGHSYKGISTDELMDSLDNLRVSVGNFDWHDCGTLKSLYEISTKTPNHKNASLGGGTFERIDCRRSLFYADEGMELHVSGAEDDAVLFTVINEKPILVIAKLSESQKIKRLAEDYLKHEDILTADFSMGARNNFVLRSNISEEIIAGFVGVNNYCIYVHRKPDGVLSAIVSQPLTPKKS
jgi:mannose-1-phosphate guanylyltransferase